MERFVGQRIQRPEFFRGQAHAFRDSRRDGHCFVPQRLPPLRQRQRQQTLVLRGARPLQISRLPEALQYGRQRAVVQMYAFCKLLLGNGFFFP